MKGMLVVEVRLQYTSWGQEQRRLCAKWERLGVVGHPLYLLLDSRDYLTSGRLDQGDDDLM